MKQEIRTAMADRAYDATPIRTLITHNLDAAAMLRREASRATDHGYMDVRTANIAAAKESIAETRQLNNMIRNWGPERTRFMESTVQQSPYELSR
jgi:uncharacterized protein (DUF305 family)